MAVIGNTITSQVFQLGLEATEGVPVAATTRLPNARFTPGWGRTASAFRASTTKFPTVIRNGREWSTFSVEGVLDFNSIVYFLSSAGNYAAPVTASGKSTWTNSFNVASANSSKAYTMEWGNTAASFRASGAHCVSFGITINRNELSYTAEMIAKQIQVGATLTSSGVTTLPYVPVPADGVSLFWGTIFNSLTTNIAGRFSHAYEYELAMENLWGQEWPINAATESWNDRYELEPDVTASLTVLEEISGTDFAEPLTLAKMRAATPIIFRLRAIGPTIAAGTPASVTGFTITDGGTGYTTPPTVTISGGGGAGAVAVAEVSAAGVVTAIRILDKGYGYTSAPTVSFTGGGGADAAATALINACHSLVIDHAVLISEEGPTPSDMDNLKVLEWPLNITADSVSGKGLDIVVVNTLAAL